MLATACSTTRRPRREHLGDDRLELPSTVRAITRGPRTAEPAGTRSLTSTATTPRAGHRSRHRGERLVAVEHHLDLDVGRDRRRSWRRRRTHRRSPRWCRTGSDHSSTRRSCAERERDALARRSAVGRGAVEDLRCARRRPVRSARVPRCATSCWRGTKSWTGMLIARAARHASACSASGSCTPVVGEEGTSTMASSPKGLNSARYCCAPRTVVPAAKYQSSAARRAHGSAADVVRRRELVRDHRLTADDLDDHARFGGRQHVGDPDPFLVRGSSRTVRDTGAASPPGITVTVAAIGSSDDAGHHHRLVGAAVGGRRAVGAEPRCRQRVRGREPGILQDRRLARAAVVAAESSSSWSTTAATSAAMTTQQDRAARSSRALTPAPTRTRRRRGLRRADRAAPCAHAVALPGGPARGGACERVRHHQRSDEHPDHQRRAEHRPALPLVAELDRHRARARRARSRSTTRRCAVTQAAPSPVASHASS